MKECTETEKDQCYHDNKPLLFDLLKENTHALVEHRCPQ